MEGAEIVRVAAKGDGVTADGRHVARAAPGDRLLADGTLVAGPHRALPPCRHFGRCGACHLQHCDDAALADFVRDRVLNAAAGQGLAPREVAPTHLSPPRTRRRAGLKAVNGAPRRARDRPLVGFLEGGSHRVFDMAECHVLHPALFALVAPLRALLARWPGRLAAEIDLALVDQGVDCTIAGLAPKGIAQTEALLDFCRDQRLARLTLDQGYGPEAFWQPEPVTVTLGGVRVDYPSGAFLQATLDGEAALVEAARAWLGGCDQVADLFAGLGTFAFALSERSKVLAVEAARDTSLACRAAAGRARRPVEAMHRDLFRSPMRPEELARFDGVLLDPPRAGAREQVAQLAAGGVPRIAYISCNPASWARDAAVLTTAGYVLEEVRPVGQFRWSTHVELASLFVKSA